MNEPYSSISPITAAMLTCALVFIFVGCVYLLAAMNCSKEPAPKVLGRSRTIPIPSRYQRWHLASRWGAPNLQREARNLPPTWLISLHIRDAQTELTQLQKSLVIAEQQGIPHKTIDALSRDERATREALVKIAQRVKAVAAQNVAYSEVAGDLQVITDKIDLLIQAVEQARYMLARLTTNLAIKEVERMNVDVTKNMQAWAEATRELETAAIYSAPAPSKPVEEITLEQQPAETTESEMPQPPKLAPGEDIITLSFPEIEQRSGRPLPPSAYKSISWWFEGGEKVARFLLNMADQMSLLDMLRWFKYLPPLQWDWRVLEVDLTNRTVSFHRAFGNIAQLLLPSMQENFLVALEVPSLAERSLTPDEDREDGLRCRVEGGTVTYTTGDGSSLLPEGVRIAFASNAEGVSVGISISIPDRDQNTWIFDELEHEFCGIEQEFGAPLTWKRVLPNSEGCTIVATRAAKLIDCDAELRELEEWLLATLAKFCQVFTWRLYAICQDIDLKSPKPSRTPKSIGRLRRTR